MSDSPLTQSSADAPDARRVPAPVLLIGFASTLFLSALLLFAVQPLFAKMVLPVLGGSPAVWSVAMCFFQAALLGGYAYAHCLNARLRTPHAVIVHLGLLLTAIAVLPLGIATGWDRPPEGGLYLWVFGLFAVSIGLPFFALAGNAPLLQAWFARTGHKHAKDPYFLYGASNLGSLLALLSYPVLIEPSMTLLQQGGLWSLGFKTLAIGVGLCGLIMLVSRVRGNQGEIQSESRLSGRATFGNGLVWMGLAFVPSGLLVAVTSHITTDVAAAPFLWVLPLALFLLTFVITFQRRPVIPHKVMLALQPVTVAALVVAMHFPLGHHWLIAVGIHLAAFFVSTMVCHGELIRRRPQASDLTGFYLWMSLGGALGGLFTGLIAPQIFSSVLEYPVMIVLALLARPGFFAREPKALWRDGAIVAVLLMLAASPKLVAGIDIIEAAPKLYLGIFTLLAAAIILSRTKPVRLAGLVTATLIAGAVLTPRSADSANYRGFFGVNKVTVTADGRFRLLLHGTTIHGAQRLTGDDARPPEPLTYYHRHGPFADVFAAARHAQRIRNVGLIGLGTGSLACYRSLDENWAFFEIDPIVVRLASDPALFNYLSDCAPDAEMIIGDARLTLADKADAHYDLLVLDAFSSDAIPVHLMTREAMEMYLSKLADTGILAFHISNRNMDLRPVLAAVAKDLGLVAMTRMSRRNANVSDTYKSAARVVALAPQASNLDPLRGMPGWEPLEGKGWRVWTDDYSNVLGAILASKRKDGEFD